MTLPRIALIATGGTIAGAAASATQTSDYAVGGVTASQLLASVPQLASVADIEAVQPFNIDSKNMHPRQWLELATQAQTMLARPDIDGLVITHGTDTLEETATALSLLLTPGKPVVMTCAMRPSSALSADGPMNLYDAVRCAANPDAARRGVMLCFGERILPALGLRKIDSHRLNAFETATADLGTTRPQVVFHAPAQVSEGITLSANLHRQPELARELARVDILHVAAGCTPDLFQAALHSGARGIVLALPGNGSVPDHWCDALQHACRQGVMVVRASRCGSGTVSGSELDARLGTLPAGILSAPAARCALMLALTAAHHDAGFDPIAFLLRVCHTGPITPISQSS